jgi:hypothetical protein
MMQDFIVRPTTQNFVLPLGLLILFCSAYFYLAVYLVRATYEDLNFRARSYGCSELSTQDPLSHAAVSKVTHTHTHTLRRKLVRVDSAMSSAQSILYGNGY